MMLLAGLGDGAADSNVPGLIHQLGSPRFSEREAASDALFELGRDALTALRGARQKGDPEVQNRVEGVIDRIERDQLRTPTYVHLTPRETTVDSALRTIEQQTGFSFQFERGPRSNWVERKVTSQSPDPRAFWDTLEALGCDGTWIVDRETGPFRMRTAPVFQINERRSSVASSIDGPFRFAFRDLRTARADLPARGFQPARTAPRIESNSLELSFELACEPRLQVRPMGPSRLTKVLDDKGRSLLPEGGDSTLSVADLWPFHEPSLALVAQIQRPAARVERLSHVHGQVNVEVQTRRLEPIEISLAPASGGSPQAPIWCGDVTFVSARLADLPFDTPAVEIVVQPEGWSQLSQMMFRGRFRRGGNGNFSEQVFESVERVIANIDVVDSQGRVLPSTPARPVRPMPDGLHITLPLTIPANAGMPHQIHYHGTLRQPMTLEFDFRDISLFPAANAR
jgi:hypothetical protein